MEEGTKDEKEDDDENKSILENNKNIFTKNEDDQYEKKYI